MVIGKTTMHKFVKMTAVYVLGNFKKLIFCTEDVCLIL
jgi:hypothetical protein